jgi:hypothetical protein
MAEQLLSGSIYFVVQQSQSCMIANAATLGLAGLKLSLDASISGGLLDVLVISRPMWAACLVWLYA